MKYNITACRIEKTLLNDRHWFICDIWGEVGGYEVSACAAGTSRLQAYDRTLIDFEHESMGCDRFIESN